jgi:hypothetical protein
MKPMSKSAFVFARIIQWKLWLFCQVFRGSTTKVNRCYNRFCNKTSFAIIICKTHCGEFHNQFCNKNGFCNKLFLYEIWYKDYILNIIMLIFLYKDRHAMSSFIKLVYMFINFQFRFIYLILQNRWQSNTVEYQHIYIINNNQF